MSCGKENRIHADFVLFRSAGSAFSAVDGFCSGCVDYLVFRENPSIRVIRVQIARKFAQIPL
jgi:hypothetical protein